MYMVYGKKTCAYCERAICLLRSRGKDFTYRSMDDRFDELKQFSTIYNWRTVPLIVKVQQDTEEFIGGYDDLVKRLQVETSEEDDK